MTPTALLKSLETEVTRMSDSMESAIATSDPVELAKRQILLSQMTNQLLVAIGHFLAKQEHDSTPQIGGSWGKGS